MRTWLAFETLQKAYINWIIISISWGTGKLLMWLEDVYRMAQKVSHLLIIIKSYKNSPLWLDISSISTRKWTEEYNKFLLNILHVT